MARLPLEGGEHPIVDPVKDLALVEELHLSLGRVDVHIHLRWPAAGSWSTQPGNLPTIFWFSIGPLQGGHQKLGLHRPAIDEKMLVGPAAPAAGGQGDKAGDGHILSLLPAPG